MHYRFESHGADMAMRCAVYGGKFGLARHYARRTPLCSRRRVDRFKARAKVITIWMSPFQSLRPAARRPGEGVMTLQISQRGKEYLKTAQTLPRTARTMTDEAIAAQLKDLADDYERRAEKASLDDAKASQ
jgi:hypothetical protein